MARRRGTCAQCGASISGQSKSGLCHPHAMARLHADPGYREKLHAAQRIADARPEVKRKRAANLAAFRATMSEAEQERRREHGRLLARTYLSDPAVRARAHSPASRAAAVAGNIRAKLGWCPAELRPLYDQLIRSKRFPAAEARRIIEGELVERARRDIASRNIAQRLRRARERREAY